MANASLSGLLGCTVQMAEREGYGALVVTVDAPRYEPAFFPVPLWGAGCGPRLDRLLPPGLVLQRYLGYRTRNTGCASGLSSPDCIGCSACGEGARQDCI